MKIFWKCLTPPIVIASLFVLNGCAKTIDPNKPLYNYQIESNKIWSNIPGDGPIQGVCMDKNSYWISRSHELLKFDHSHNHNVKYQINVDQYFTGANENHHIGDIDVYGDYLCTVGENFENSVGNHIEVAYFNSNNLTWSRTINIYPDDYGLHEVSGVTFDVGHNLIWISSWAEGATGQYLYYYKLSNFQYLGKLKINPWVQKIQGIKYYNNFIFASCDDNQPWFGINGKKDHLYRINPQTGDSTLEYTFNDFADDQETEGLTIDTNTGEFLILQQDKTLNYFKTTRAQ